MEQLGALQGQEQLSVITGNISQNQLRLTGTYSVAVTRAYPHNKPVDPKAHVVVEPGHLPYPEVRLRGTTIIVTCNMGVSTVQTF